MGTVVITGGRDRNKQVLSHTVHLPEGLCVHSMPVANAPKSLQTERILIHMLTIVTGQTMKWITILKGLVCIQYIRC